MAWHTRRSATPARACGATSTGSYLRTSSTWPTISVQSRGMPESEAIATAISLCKKWAAGGKDVKPDTRAKAAAAVAEWERLKARRQRDKEGGAMTDLMRIYPARGHPHPVPRRRRRLRPRGRGVRDRVRRRGRRDPRPPGPLQRGHRPDRVRSGAGRIRRSSRRPRRRTSRSCTTTARRSAGRRPPNSSCRSACRSTSARRPAAC